MIETIYRQYVYQYEKYGVAPTRIVLGAEVVREATKQLQYCSHYGPFKYGPFKINNLNGKMFCFGTPITVDKQNPKLINISTGEDYTLEKGGVE